jgi:hypothetical protein
MCRRAQWLQIVNLANPDRLKRFVGANSLFGNHNSRFRKLGCRKRKLRFRSWQFWFPNSQTWGAFKTDFRISSDSFSGRNGPLIAHSAAPLFFLKAVMIAAFGKRTWK